MQECERHSASLRAPGSGACGITGESYDDWPANGRGIDESPTDAAVTRAPEHAQASADDGGVPDVVRSVREVVRIKGALVLKLWQHRNKDALASAPPKRGERRKGVAHGEGVILIVIILCGQADLLEIVRTLDTPGGLACCLHGGQKQGDQHGDDRDHHQELDQCEAAGSGLRSIRSHRGSSFVETGHKDR
jgi:hypothetical protein